MSRPISTIVYREGNWMPWFLAWSVKPYWPNHIIQWWTVGDIFCVPGQDPSDLCLAVNVWIIAISCSIVFGDGKIKKELRRALTAAQKEAAYFKKREKKERAARKGNLFVVTSKVLKAAIAGALEINGAFETWRRHESSIIELYIGTIEFDGNSKLELPNESLSRNSPGAQFKAIQKIWPVDAFGTKLIDSQGYEIAHLLPAGRSEHYQWTTIAWAVLGLSVGSKQYQQEQASGFIALSQSR